MNDPGPDPIGILNAAIETLEEATERFVAELGPANWVGPRDSGHFRFARRDPQVIQVLRCVRVASSLWACMTLLESGFVTEIGVLLRTVHEFLEDIGFMHSALQGDPSPYQIEFVESFFVATPTTVEGLQSEPRRSRVARQRVRASQARALSPDDPHRMVQISRVIEGVFGGFVHGSYASIMDMYEGGTNVFRLRGMLGTPRIDTWRWQIATHVQRSLNDFGFVAWSLRIDDLFHSLRAARDAFERSVAYQR